MHASGSSVPSVSAPRWGITMLPGTACQTLWTIVGMGRTSGSNSLRSVAQRLVRWPLRRRTPSRHAGSAWRRPASRRRKFPRTPSSRHGPRHCRQRLCYWDGRGAGRCIRPQRQHACVGRRRRFLAVLRWRTHPPRRARGQSWGQPSTAQGPFPSSRAWGASGLRNAITAVCVGCLRRPKRVPRFGSTALRFRAAAASWQPLPKASTQRPRKPRPCRRGRPSCSNHSSQTGWSHTGASMGERTPPGTTPGSACVSTPSSLTPARSYFPMRRTRRPSLTR
jgi:hypothetical protein